MILLDLSQVIIAAAQAQFSRVRPSEFTEDFFRHMALNTIRANNVKYRGKYGEMVLCADARSYWRKDEFPHYKASRKALKAASKFPWDEFHEWFTRLKEDLRTVFPYKLILVDKAEADDVIGALTMRYAAHEPIIILSADGDFQQLQKYSGVTQFSPKRGGTLKCKNVQEYLREHIIRGDKGDGIPNVFSDPDTFVCPEKRQTAIKKVDMADWIKMPKKEFCQVAGVDIERYELNERLVDLHKMPDELFGAIIAEYNTVETGNKNKILTYFMKHRMKLLTDCLPDF